MTLGPTDLMPTVVRKVPPGFCSCVAATLTINGLTTCAVCKLPKFERR